MKTMTRWQQYIKENLTYLGVDETHVEVWTENGKPVSGGMHDTPDGMRYIDFEYRLATAVDEMPAEVGGLLIAMAYHFVDGLDRAELEEIDIDISPLDEGRLVNVEITFGVRDPIFLEPVQNSPIVINGQKMGFSPGSWNVATNMDLKGDVKR